ncbi:MAG TPA: type II toxin-antitoxin system VapC family toxin [Rhizomicrobium sp.]|jgi:tRNA(fMet)-specific endonuclease VapC|nr:type II toxin-antitoxin system VapC family toxin [Rhizomicrobium sp.]
MPRFMLDTDTCSYIVKRSNHAVLRRLQTVPIDEVCISAITEAELQYGVQVSPRQHTDGVAVGAFLRHIDVLDFSGDAATSYAEIRADLKRRGAMIGAHDLLIAAHARSLDMTLVTNNVREFKRVRGLAIENWAARGTP